MGAPVWRTWLFRDSILYPSNLMALTPSKSPSLWPVDGKRHDEGRTPAFQPPQPRSYNISFPFTFHWCKPVIWPHLNTGREDGGRGEND